MSDELVGIAERLSIANDGENSEREAIRMILHPLRCRPVQHKDNQTVGEYLECCKQNIEAEIWGWFSTQTASSSILEKIEVKYSAGNRTITGAWKDNAPLSLKELRWTMLILNGTMCLITHLKNDQAVIFEGKKLNDSKWHKTDSTTDISVAYLMGYVKPYVKEYSAILKYIRGRVPCCKVLKDVASPIHRSAFKYSRNAFYAGVPYNPLQGQCILELAYTLEGIQGPPGTGKSTTIFHIVNSAIPSKTHAAIVTCVQNKAVDAIAEKFAANNASLPFLAFGSEERIGDTAARFTLSEQVKRDPAVVVQRRERDRCARIHGALASALRALEAARFPSDRPFRARLWAEKSARLRPGADKEALQARFRAGDPWQRWWCAFARRTRGAALVADAGTWGSRAKAASALLRQTEAAAEQRLLDGARAFLCTVDSVSSLPKDRLLVPKRWVLIIDEAGTVPEYKMPLLISLGAEAVVAVGDQNQLSPFSHACGPGAAAPSSGFFQRLVRAAGAVPMLREQYRMHPAVCRFVSDAFYDGLLWTSPAVSAARLAMPRGGVRWVDLPRGAAESGCSRRRHNPAELALMADFFRVGLRPLLESGKSVLVITFYKEQFRRLMQDGERAGLVKSKERVAQERMRSGGGAVGLFVDPGLRIATVDAAQGSEADVVLLSCVRCNASESGRTRTGFLSNRNRMCVAISRARERLVIVGSAETLGTDPVWRGLRAAAAKDDRCW